LKQEGANAETGSMLVVKLPMSLVTRIKRRLGNSDFSSVDEYVAYVVDQVLTELESNSGQDKPKGENVFSKEDQENVEQRLRDLGYL
jgi:hypothetical protein